MKLLICTQAVDAHDPILGFFHRWIEEFAKHCAHVSVICLREGSHRLPKNVRVFSLGKEALGAQTGFTRRILYAARFLKYTWRLRHEYDSVFVHMNPEYAMLGGLLWRLWGKKIGLWYVHKNVDLKLRVAMHLTRVAFSASKESFRLKTRKLRIIGHGIDTAFFTPEARTVRGAHWVSVGRLHPSKRHDLAIRAAAAEGRTLHIAGEGPEREGLEALV